MQNDNVIDIDHLDQRRSFKAHQVLTKEPRATSASHIDPGGLSHLVRFL